MDIRVSFFFFFFWTILPDVRILKRCLCNTLLCYSLLYSTTLCPLLCLIHPCTSITLSSSQLDCFLLSSTPRYYFFVCFTSSLTVFTHCPTLPDSSLLYTTLLCCSYISSPLPHTVLLFIWLCLFSVFSSVSFNLRSGFWF